MNKIITLFIFGILLFSQSVTLVHAQVLSNRDTYSEADSLRGSLRPERAYDVLKYHLQVKLVPEDRFISGFNRIVFETEQQLPVMQVDLFENMRVDSIVHEA